MAGQDLDVLEKVRRGDASAYIELVHRYQNRLRSVLSFYCHSAEEIEEFTQDAFVEGFTHIDRFDPSRPFFPWLRTIAVNILRMELRRKDREKRLGAVYLRRVQMARVEVPGAEEREASDALALDHCLEKLSPRNSRLIEEKYRRGRSYGELADMFGAAEDALRTRMLRIRQKLKQCIRRFRIERERPAP
jgi:RNA polymerase sigma-70 factor (ECF subfamily)